MRKTFALTLAAFAATTLSIIGVANLSNGQSTYAEATSETEETAPAWLLLSDNRDGAVNTVSASATETGVSVNGTLANARSILMMNTPVAVGEKVTFSMSLEFDTTGIAGGSYKVNDYFSILFAEAKFDESGIVDPASLSFKNTSGNGAAFQTYLMDEEKKQNRADLNFSTYTKKDIVNGDSVYGFGGNSLSDAYNDLGWAISKGLTFNVEIGVEKIGGVEYLYYTMPEINRDNGYRITTPKFSTPLSDVVTIENGNAFYTAFELANLDSTVRTVNYQISNYKVESKGLVITPSDIYLKPTMTKQVSVSLSGSDSLVNAAFTVDDESVATIDENGTITALKAGTTKITAEYAGKKGEFYVTVANNLVLDSNALQLMNGAYKQLSATTNPSGLKVLWSSSDETVATIDENGLISTLSEGECTITAKIFNFESEELEISATCALTVSAYTQPENVYGSDYNIIYSDGAITDAKVSETQKGYAFSGNIQNGKYLLSLNETLNLDKPLTFDISVNYDASSTNDSNFYNRYFGVYLGYGDAAKLTAEDFAGTEGKNGCTVQLSANASWWAWGGKQLLGVYYGSAVSWHKENITTGANITLDSAGYEKFASAFARMFNAGGRIQVRIAKIDNEIHISFTPVFVENEVCDGTEGTTYPDGAANEYIGPYTFVYDWSDVFNSATDGNWYVAVGFGNSIPGTSAKLDIKIENINFGKLYDFTLNKSSYLMKKETTYQLTATTNPNTYQASSIEWSSSDSSIATVDENGLVSAIGTGRVEITCTIDGISKKCTIDSIGGLTVDTSEKSLAIGEVFKLTATADPSTTEITFVSADERIAKVDENGNVTAIAEGTTTIYAKIGDLYTATCSVTVTAKGGNNTSKKGCSSTLALNCGIILVSAIAFSTLIVRKKRKY